MRLGRESGECKRKVCETSVQGTIPRDHPSDCESTRRVAEGCPRPVDLADAAGLNVGAVRDLEQGRKVNPAWTTVLALCGVLGVTPDAFIRQPAERPPAGRGRPAKTPAVPNGTVAPSVRRRKR